MSTPASVTTGVIFFILAITLCYAVACGIYPYKTCRSCHGAGRHRSGVFGGIRLCRRCDGDGLTLRFGRRIHNAMAHTYRRYHRDAPRKRTRDND